MPGETAIIKLRYECLSAPGTLHITHEGFFNAEKHTSLLQKVENV